MSGASWKHYYEEQASTSLTYDRPVDTFATATAIDNVAHLVDVSPVYRVNWVDPHGIRALRINDGEARHQLLIAHDFPTTIIRPWEYPNYDVRIAAAIAFSDAPMFVYAHISSLSGPYFTILDDPSLIGHLVAPAVEAAAPAWVIDGTIRSAGRNTSVTPAAVSITDMSIDHVGEGTSAYVVMARLSVFISAPDLGGSDYAALYGIQVREFVNDD